MSFNQPNSTAGVANEAHAEVAIDGGSLCDDRNKMTLRAPTGFAIAPPEIILDILGYLNEKKDWFSLARTCRHVSVVILAELDKYMSLEGHGYAFRLAIVTNNTTMLLHQIACDPAIVNRHFTHDFSVNIKRIDYSSSRYMSPLAVAIDAGRNGIVQLLLHHGADPNLPDNAPTTWEEVCWYPIHWAVESKLDSSVAVIRMLKDYAADMNQLPKCEENALVEPSDSLVHAPIFRTLRLDQPHRILTPSERLTSCDTYNDDFKKAQALRLHQLRALLECGANPNIRFGWGLVTPIFSLLSHLASYRPAFYFSDKLMLSHEIEAQATLVNNIVISFLDTLREFGADIRASGDVFYRDTSSGYHQTPLHAVCRLKDQHKPLIYWFLRNGANINDLSETNNTPLMTYCVSHIEDTDKFDEFLSYPHMINHCGSKGRTALHNLCANAYLTPQVKEKTVRMMLDAGADPTVRADNGRTPAEEIFAIIQRAHPKKDSISAKEMRIMTPFKDVLEMVEDAEKKWEKRKGKGKNGEGPVSADKFITRCSERVGQRYNNPRGGYRGHVVSSKENGEANSADGQEAIESTIHGKTQKTQKERRRNYGNHERRSQSIRRNDNQVRDKSSEQSVETNHADGPVAIESAVHSKSQILQEKRRKTRGSDKHRSEGAQHTIDQGNDKNSSHQVNALKTFGLVGSGRCDRHSYERSEETVRGGRARGGQRSYRGRHGRRGGRRQAGTPNMNNEDNRHEEKWSGQSTLNADEERPIIERLLRSNQQTNNKF